MSVRRVIIINNQLFIFNFLLVISKCYLKFKILLSKCYLKFKILLRIKLILDSFSPVNFEPELSPIIEWCHFVGNYCHVLSNLYKVLLLSQNKSKRILRTLDCSYLFWI